jgi:hypothetical protein
MADLAIGPDSTLVFEVELLGFRWRARCRRAPAKAEVVAAPTADEHFAIYFCATTWSRPPSPNVYSAMNNQRPGCCSSSSWSGCVGTHRWAPVGTPGRRRAAHRSGIQAAPWVPRAASEVRAAQRPAAAPFARWGPPLSPSDVAGDACSRGAPPAIARPSRRGGSDGARFPNADLTAAVVSEFGDDQRRACGSRARCRPPPPPCHPRPPGPSDGPAKLRTLQSWISAGYPQSGLWNHHGGGRRTAEATVPDPFHATSGRATERASPGRAANRDDEIREGVHRLGGRGGGGGGGVGGGGGERAGGEQQRRGTFIDVGGHRLSHGARAEISATGPTVRTRALVVIAGADGANRPRLTPNQTGNCCPLREWTRRSYPIARRWCSWGAHERVMSAARAYR